MNREVFKKGKFYTLPVRSVREEGNCSFFIVEANKKEYAIRMFDFQRGDRETASRSELPCMVKDVHGDNIVFVQNFAQMFGDRYEPGKAYSFIVNKGAYNPSEEYRYYDVRDDEGVPFRLKCRRDTYLVPQQRIFCTITRPDKNRLILSLIESGKRTLLTCKSPQSLLQEIGIDSVLTRYILMILHRSDVFLDAREYFRANNPEWVVKALLSIENVENWPLRREHREGMLRCYHRLCLYVIEDSDYLLQFSDSERENFQEWIAGRIAMAETYLESLNLIHANRCSEEIDNILEKIRNSGYIYNPRHKMELLISIFSLRPAILEEKIDTILDLIALYAKEWRQASFNHAFARFLEFYIRSNRERVYREAVVENNNSTVLLKRMVRSICYLLLMSNDAGRDRPLYRSMLYHYLSYVRSKNLQGKEQPGQDEVFQRLLDHAFASLLLSDDEFNDFSWAKDFTQVNTLAYQLSSTQLRNTTFLTRSYETDNVRFTVSMEGITFSRTTSGNKERNVLPEGFPGWHNIQIFLDGASKYSITKLSQLKTWCNYWRNVETDLFEQRPQIVKRHSKLFPDVGTETVIRVLWRESDALHPCRFYCKIEDDMYQGTGWLDTYVKGGTTSLFHYDPKFDIESFYADGKPMLLHVRINAIVSQQEEKRTYIFDALSFIDQFVREEVQYSDEVNCQLIFKDDSHNVYYGVTEHGYGLFVPDVSEDIPYTVGDMVRVRHLDSTKPSAIQGEVFAMATQPVDITKAAETLLQSYMDDVYEESEEELESDAMSVSEDQFEPEYIREIINIFDHKAVLEKDNKLSYAYLSVAHILSHMIGDTVTMGYLEQRRNFIRVMDDYAQNGKVDDEELDILATENADIVERFPIIRRRFYQIRILNSIGLQKKNEFLWSVLTDYSDDYILNKLSRLVLSYNMADGFDLQEQQKLIIARIKDLLNIKGELPEIYSFGEEDQLTEFKTSIVFPPNNNMREDINQQTFNIMKVICGMANTYGGRVYLGVDDTGVARGLADDLAIPFFDNNRDKYDRYIRNKIRQTMGDAVNASIAIEHPEAGKHWLYVIKVAPSKVPVCLGLDNKYYLREGSSTHAIDNLEQLTGIMNDRDYELFHVQPAADVVVEESVLPPMDFDEVPKEEKHERPATTEDHLATSVWRSNVVDNWVEGYGVETVCFLRILRPGEWCVCDDIEWEAGILTLAIHDDEVDGSLILAYEDGRVNRVPISQLIDKTRGNIYKMYAHKSPVFVCPARKDAAVLTAYCDDKGRKHARLDDVENIEEGKMLSAGTLLTDVSFENLYACEIINPDCFAELKRLRNHKRTSIGLPMNVKLNKEREILIDMGIGI